MTNVTNETKRSMTERLRVDEIRNRIAQVVWLVAVACALILVAAALLIALGGNDGNALVDFVKQTAARLDFDVFDRNNGVFDFEGKNAATKNAVVNYGLAALVWLVAGKILSGIIRK